MYSSEYSFHGHWNHGNQGVVLGVVGEHQKYRVSKSGLVNTEQGLYRLPAALEVWGGGGGGGPT